MENRDMLPPPRFNLAKCGEQFERIGIKIHARRGVRIRQQKNFPRAVVLPADDTTRFVRCVALRLSNQLSQLLARDLHVIPGVVGARLVHTQGDH
jgi:hypothetical protein